MTVNQTTATSPCPSNTTTAGPAAEIVPQTPLIAAEMSYRRKLWGIAYPTLTTSARKKLTPVSRMTVIAVGSSWCETCRTDAASHGAAIHRKTPPAVPAAQNHVSANLMTPSVNWN